jgi:TusA-related sulfurtransferase/uncharacterized OsmC-like protein
MIAAENRDQLPADIPSHVVCDGGNLDCGSGLLLIIRKSMDEVPPGGVLEIRSTELSVCEDLPAWCRLTENPYLGWRQQKDVGKFFVRRGSAAATDAADSAKARDYRWQCRAHWAGGLTTKIYARNHGWETGQPASFDLADPAPSAVEQLLGALAGCLVMGFQLHASRRGIAIEEVELSLSGKLDNIFVFLGLDSAGHPGFADISGTLFVRSDAPPETLEDIWQHTRAVSPVASSLSQSIRLQLTLQSGF